MLSTVTLRAAIASLLILGAGLSGCKSDPNRRPPDNPFRPGQPRTERELRLEASQLYAEARVKLDTGDFTGALTDYRLLQSRFPFSDYATQAELESIFAQYRNYEPDLALAAADRFTREHPRHEAIDYVVYLKGMTNYSRGESFIDRVPGIDPTRHDMTHARRAFDDFSSLVQRYPNSKYSADARARMLHLRNQIARHELHVVQFYMRRGAYVAAAQRAQQVVADYPGAPSSYEALQALAEAYAALGLTQQAQEAQAILTANEPAMAAQTDLTPKTSWWRWLWPFGSKSSDVELPPG